MADLEMNNRRENGQEQLTRTIRTPLLSESWTGLSSVLMVLGCVISFGTAFTQVYNGVQVGGAGKHFLKPGSFNPKIIAYLNFAFSLFSCFLVSIWLKCVGPDRKAGKGQFGVTTVASLACTILGIFSAMVYAQGGIDGLIGQADPNDPRIRNAGNLSNPSTREFTTVAWIGGTIGLLLQGGMWGLSALIIPFTKIQRKTVVPIA